MRAPLSWLRDYAPLERRRGRPGRRPVRASAWSSKASSTSAPASATSWWPGSLAIRPHPERRPDPPGRRRRRRRRDRCRSCAGRGTSPSATWSRWPRSAPSCPGGFADLPAQDAGRVVERDAVLGRASWSCPSAAGDGRRPADPAGRVWPPPGTPLVEALDLHPDVVFDLDISPNRPDALCMAGVARDLAAALGETVVATARGPPSVAVDAGRRDRAVWSSRAGDLCPRFTATILEGVPDGPSPAWMARRLTLAGMRPINAVVDVSNYVMLDLGQPNHAYDLDRLGGGGLLVRRGRPGETLVTLDGVERSLEGDDCVICDAAGAPRRRRRHHGRQPGPRSAPAPGGCCWRRPGSSRWPSPGPEAGWGCTPRPGSASSGASTPRWST